MLKDFCRLSVTTLGLVLASMTVHAENQPVILIDNTLPIVSDENFITGNDDNASDVAGLTEGHSEDWIRTKVARANKGYQVLNSDDILLNNEISFKWDISDSMSLSLNVFDNYLLNSSVTGNSFNYQGFSHLKNYSVINKSLGTQSYTPSASGLNNNYSGYRLGISSQLGLGDEYKLNVNFDYGQIDGAESVGFSNDEVTTTSFGLGIRKNKFGASVNTDIYLQGNDTSDIGLLDNSRLGFELDWHFSDETKISLGSKKRINNDTSNVQPGSLESLTGNVQYIKFQHNL